ncbi:MAG: hypothetical protein OXG99_14905 [Alphaproteobacteria bacterium]|nr:hypothetical protein [Alphaproteobacteria bacterium]
MVAQATKSRREFDFHGDRAVGWIAGGAGKVRPFGSERALSVKQFEESFFGHSGRAHIVRDDEARDILSLGDDDRAWNPVFHHHYMGSVVMVDCETVCFEHPDQALPVKRR